MVFNQFFAELTTTNGIIVVGLIYKRSVDTSTEFFFYFSLEDLISLLDRFVKTYMLDHNLSPPVKNFINQMISKNFLPTINRPTRETLHSCPSGIFLPGTELLQSPFRMEFSMGSRSRPYRRSLRRHRRFLRSYRRSLRRCRDPWGDRRCGNADRCAIR